MMPSPRRQPAEEYDLSSIQPPVKLGISGAEQVARCLAGGSDEIKHLLQQECHLIFECCVCTGLFRSLANFLAHKRVYCKEDHILPSSDLASHVSILRQYIQTKAAAMATLAEGASNQSSPTGSNLGTPPDEFVGSTPVAPLRVLNGAKPDQKEADLGEVSKKRKMKPGIGQRLDQAQVKSQLNAIPCVEVSKEKVNGKEKLKSAEKLKNTDKMKSPEKLKGSEKAVKPAEKLKSIETPSTGSLKKKYLFDALPNHIKRPQVKRKLLGAGGDMGDEVNGSVNLADSNTLSNQTDLVIGGNDGNDSAKKVKTVRGKGAFMMKQMECSVVMKEKDRVVHPAVPIPVTVTDKPDTVKGPPVKTTKSPKKDMAPHLLYPCLYCDNVFPGTRMAIDHISTIHKKRKTINVSKIRTKIRKKAFVVKSGKKTRRFQKSSKSLETRTGGMVVGSALPSSSITTGDNGKVRKRSHISYQCSQCNKVYLYKTAMERHQLTCTSIQKLAAWPNRTVGESSPTSPSRHTVSPWSTPKTRKGSAAGASAVSSGGSATTYNHKTKSEKKNASKPSKSSSPMSTSLKNCPVVGEIVLSSDNKIKSEPNSPYNSVLLEAGIDVVSTSSGGTKVDDSPFVIPIKSEYPCPYCLVKARKTFDLLFQHISEKHRDLRPSRKRVARFLMNSGYRCTWCKDPPRFFKNRITLRRHRVKEHGMKYRPFATPTATDVTPKS